MRLLEQDRVPAFLVAYVGAGVEASLGFVGALTSVKAVVICSLISYNIRMMLLDIL